MFSSYHLGFWTFLALNVDFWLKIWILLPKKQRSQYLTRRFFFVKINTPLCGGDFGCLIEGEGCVPGNSKVKTWLSSSWTSKPRLFKTFSFYHHHVSEEQLYKTRRKSIKNNLGNLHLGFIKISYYKISKIGLVRILIFRDSKFTLYHRFTPCKPFLGTFLLHFFIWLHDHCEGGLGPPYQIV